MNQSNKNGGPLAGIRVLDFSHAMAGPFAAQKLGDMGAQVTKIEPPGAGEWHRAVAGGNAWVNHHNSSFLAFNRNKRSLAVNLKTDAGRQIVYRLARSADVVLINYRAGVAERLGIDYGSLVAENGNLVYCSVTGYGESGPYSRLPAQDLVVQGLSGAVMERRPHHRSAAAGTILCLRCDCGSCGGRSDSRGPRLSRAAGCRAKS